MRYVTLRFLMFVKSSLLLPYILLSDYFSFVGNIIGDYRFWVSIYIFQFFRKVLYADYYWFLFSSSTSYLLKRYV